MKNGRPAAISDKKKLQNLMRQLLFKDCSNLDEASDEATIIIMSDPQFRGVLKSIVEQAVAEAICRIVTVRSSKAIL